MFNSFFFFNILMSRFYNRCTKKFLQSRCALLSKLEMVKILTGIAKVPPTYCLWNPKMVIFSHLMMWVTYVMEGGKKVKRPGVEIARV